MEVVASLSQVRTAAAQCGLFTHKSVPVIFEPPCISKSETKLRKKLLHQVLEHGVIPVVGVGSLKDGRSGLGKRTKGGWSSHAAQY